MSPASHHRLIGWLAFLGALFLLRGAFTIVYLTLIFGWTTGVLMRRFPAKWQARSLRRTALLTVLHVTVIGSACALAGGAVAYLARESAAAFDSTRRGDPEGALRDALRRALAGLELYRTYGRDWATSPLYQKERDEAWDDEVSGHRADCMKSAAVAQPEAARLHEELRIWLAEKRGGQTEDKLPAREREAAYAELLASKQTLLGRLRGTRPCAPVSYAQLLEVEQCRDEAAFERVRERWFLEWKAARLAAAAGTAGPMMQIVEVVSKSIPMVAGWLGSIVSGLLGMGLDVVCGIVFSFLVVWALPDLEESAGELAGTEPGLVWSALREDLVRLGEALFNGFVALVIIGALNGVVAGALLDLCGVTGALYLGAIVMMCSLIPYLGKLIAVVPVCLVAFSQGGQGMAASALAVLVVAHVLETLIWNPFVLSRWLRLKPLTVTLVQIPGQIVFGIWGLLLAPPVADFVWEMATRRAEPPRP